MLCKDIWTVSVDFVFAIVIAFNKIKICSSVQPNSEKKMNIIPRSSLSNVVLKNTLQNSCFYHSKHVLKHIPFHTSRSYACSGYILLITITDELSFKTSSDSLIANYFQCYYSSIVLLCISAFKFLFWFLCTHPDTKMF